MTGQSRLKPTYAVVAMALTAASFGLIHTARSDDGTVDLTDAGVVWTLFIVGEEEYWVGYSLEKLENTETWNVGDEGPPLTLNEAHRIAHAKLADVVAEPSEWECYTCTLERADDKGHWLWKINFGRLDIANQDEEWLGIGVYLDGTALDVLVGNENVGNKGDAALF